MSTEFKFIRHLQKSKIKKRVFLEILTPTASKRLFHIKKDELYEFVRYKLELLKNDFLEAINEDHFLPTNHRSQKSFWTYGIITSNTPNDFKSSKIKIFSNIDSSNDMMVELNTNFLKQYAVYPGQIAAIYGKNIKGDEIIAEKICTMPVSSLNTIPDADIEKYNSIYDEEPLKIRIFSGPINIDNSKQLAPYFVDTNTDVAIFFGPFIQSISNQGSDLIWKKFYEEILQDFFRKKPQGLVLLIPSLDDLTSLGIYPQELLHTSLQDDRVVMLTNPSIVSINGMRFSFSNYDNLIDISTNEVCVQNQNANSYVNDEFSRYISEKNLKERICTHLLFQRTFCPKLPPSAPVDFQEKSALFFDVLPDFYVTTSKLSSLSVQVAFTTVLSVCSAKDPLKRDCIELTVRRTLDKNASMDNKKCVDINILK